MDKCNECKYCDEEGLCTSYGDEECYGDAYQQGRADAIDEVLEIIRDCFGYSTSEMIRRVEQLKEQK